MNKNILSKTFIKSCTRIKKTRRRLLNITQKTTQKLSNTLKSSENASKSPMNKSLSPLNLNLKLKHSFYPRSRQSVTPLRKRRQTPQQVFSKLKLPIRPRQALCLFKTSLSLYQQKQIKEFDKIYYLGLQASKLQPPYSQEKGNYKAILKDHINYRYQILKLLGSGAFGKVYMCFDHMKKQNLAIKIIKNIQEYVVQASMEVKILNYLNEKDSEDTFNIVRMKEFFVFRQHIFLVFELLDKSLYNLLQSNDFQGFSLNLIRKFAIQILLTLKYIHKHQVIHCDLKPQNILLKNPKKCGIKIIDFGSSCFQTEKLWMYIQSRFYRAPEVLLQLGYSCAIDMWSFGCLLGELYTGNPLFPGGTESEQFRLIVQTIGLPPDEMLPYISQHPKFAQVLEQVNLHPTNPLSEIVENSAFASFLQKCLDWNPFSRLTPDQGLKEPWILAEFNQLDGT